jgi:hypothetical protein
MLNHQKYYDEEDNLVGEENICFEFEKDEVYNINLTIIPEKQENVLKQLCDPHILRFNDLFYNLKLKSSREFTSIAKKQHSNNAFYSSEYTASAKWRMGIKECYENGILDKYDVLCTKSKENVYHLKFTIVVGHEKGTILKYS